MGKVYRLGRSAGLLQVLEPLGGLQPSQVYKSRKGVNPNEEEVPESAIIPYKRAIQGTVEQTPAMLESLAANDEITAVLERISSHVAIVPTDGSSFAYPALDRSSNIKMPESEDLLDTVKNYWIEVQKQLWSNKSDLCIGVHQFVQDYLTYGYLWLCVIRFSDKDKRIRKIIVSRTEPTVMNLNGTPVYRIQDNDVQTAKGQTKEPRFAAVYDINDIILLTYTELNPYCRSYVATLTRSFNLYRTIERTRIANAIMKAQFRSVYTVPTKGLGKIKARQRLSTIMGMYKRDIRIEDTSGSVTINGENTYPVNTEIWVAETSGGGVSIDNPGDGDPDLNNTDLVEYFNRKFYKTTKLPISKYEAVDSGYLNGLNEIDEDEDQYKLYINKLRAVLGKAFIKLTLRFMVDDKQYGNRVDLQENLVMSFYDKERIEEPSEQIEKQDDIMSKISNMLSTYKEMLTDSGMKDAQVSAKVNAFRIKLMRKYLPDVFEMNDEDYRNVDEEEGGDSSDGGSDFGGGSDYNPDGGGDTGGDTGGGGDFGGDYASASEPDENGQFSLGGQ
jgi:hypothetical protein